ncbi:hypothetical protein Zm00014a_033538 [Zea mays]|uniref:Uncharacterized protein n=1 Tax=Zea mays TaxID=4577 RepID=A0A317YD49_MAIZE|nr:hypothetical protein Zm00014a_033538 [Zea mays]
MAVLVAEFILRFTVMLMDLEVITGILKNKLLRHAIILIPNWIYDESNNDKRFDKYSGKVASEKQGSSNDRALREELSIFSKEVIRFGNLCKDPIWHNLGRYFDKYASEKLATDNTPQDHSKGSMEAIVQQLINLAQNTSIIQFFPIRFMLQSNFIVILIGLTNSILQADEELLSDLGTDVKDECTKFDLVDNVKRK